MDLPAPRLKVVELKPKPAATVDIEAAEVLVTVGRGVARKEDLALVEALAAALGGEVGCTRPLSHDLHWLLESRMVGISGKRASPRLNVALGLSGQIQHSVGIMGAKLIVAVNKDKSAPIFQLADYGVVGDLYEVVPALLEELGKG